MMTWPHALLLVHVLSALWLSAAAFGGTVVRAAGKRAPDLAGKVGALRIAHRLASVFGLPGSILAGLTGLLLLFYGPVPWGLKPGWVHASIGLWFVLLGLNLFYNFPRLARTLAAAEASLAAGAPSDELERLTASKAPGIIADLTALGVVIFVVLMVMKPF
ncbi:MAG TPA: DUF2269 family protein [Thermoanaerobaculia bacterium]|jgi:uncharacterized membrane protein